VHPNPPNDNGGIAQVGGITGLESAAVATHRELVRDRDGTVDLSNSANSNHVRLVGSQIWVRIDGWKGGTQVDDVQYVRPVRVPIHPIAGTHRVFGSRGGAHAGIDLVPTHNLRQGLQEPFPYVYAVADGVVIAYYLFYRGTYALEIRKDDDRIVRYCEIHALDGVRVGVRVKQGQEVARMGRMTGINEVMVHLEYFKGTASGGLTNRNNIYPNWQYDYVTPMNFSRRRDLLDPTFFSELP